MKRIPSFVLVLVLEGANAEKQIALDLNNSACSREEKKKIITWTTYWDFNN